MLLVRFMKGFLTSFLGVLGTMLAGLKMEDATINVTVFFASMLFSAIAGGIGGGFLALEKFFSADPSEYTPLLPE